MMFSFDDANKKSKEAMDAVLKSYSEVAKGFQAITVEAAEYSKKSFAGVSAHAEALSEAKSVETALALQQGFLKSSYEGLVAEFTKMNGMYVDLAKTVYRPFEAPVGKTGAR